MPAIHQLLGLFACLATTVLGLFFCIQQVDQQRRRQWLGWSVLGLLMLGALLLSRSWSGWWRLLGTWAAVFVGFKALALLYTARSRLAGLSWWRYLGFTLGWVGMDVEPWTRPAQPRSLPDGSRMLIEGLAMLGGWLGLAILLAGTPLLAQWPLVQGWCVLVALIVASFFGFSRLLTGYWRSLGRDVALPFDQPVYAVSLADWWGNRWNRPVHQIFNQTIWQPVRSLGIWWATALVFGASGLLHEYVLSYPAGGGYGLPLSYFLIQAVGMRLERTKPLKRWLKRSKRGRAAWTLGVTLIPSPLLFHPVLLEALIIPFLGLRMEQ